MEQKMNPLEQLGKEISKCLEPIRRSFGDRGGIAILGSPAGPAPSREGTEKLKGK